MDSNQIMSGIPMLVFFLIGTVAVASSILVVAMRNPVHSALFLLVTFLCVAALFIMQGAEFVGAVQVLVYAGGIMVLFLFVVMLINVRHLPEEKMLSPYGLAGAGVALVLFILFASMVRPGSFHDEVLRPDYLQRYGMHKHHKVKMADGRTVRRNVVKRSKRVGNSEAIGMLLYGDYLVPFEVASLFLLVGMVGAIVIGKRQLEANQEEAIPAYMADRVAEEKEIKGAMSA